MSNPNPRLDTGDTRAHNCGAWLYAGDHVRVLLDKEYSFMAGVYRFRKQVPFEHVFVLVQYSDGSVRILP